MRARKVLRLHLKVQPLVGPSLLSSFTHNKCTTKHTRTTHAHKKTTLCKNYPHTRTLRTRTARTGTARTATHTRSSTHTTRTDLCKQLVPQDRERRHPGPVIRNARPFHEASASETVEVGAGVNALIHVLEDVRRRLDAAFGQAEPFRGRGRVLERPLERNYQLKPEQRHVW